VGPDSHYQTGLGAWCDYAIPAAARQRSEGALFGITLPHLEGADAVTVDVGIDQFRTVLA
jgi:hypothetical protein